MAKAQIKNIIYQYDWEYLRGCVQVNFKKPAGLILFFTSDDLQCSSSEKDMLEYVQDLLADATEDDLHPIH